MMHAGAQEFVKRVRKEYLPKFLPLVIEYGSRDVNGSIREHFVTDGTVYLGIDLVPGRNVDIATDASIWRPPKPANVIICCEMLEHTQRTDRIVNNVFASLLLGGYFIMTCACDPRPPHSASDGGKLRAGEYYRNVDPLTFWMHLRSREIEVCAFEVHRARGDLYVLAQKACEG